MTCRQIREETCPIWISKNTFSVHIGSFDHRLFFKWRKLLSSIVSKRSMIEMTFDDVCEWDNLLRWCQADHLDKSIEIPVTEDGDIATDIVIPSAIVTSALAITYGILGQPWQICEFVLRKFRFAMECAGVEWE